MRRHILAGSLALLAAGASAWAQGAPPAAGPPPAPPLKPKAPPAAAGQFPALLVDVTIRDPLPGSSLNSSVSEQTMKPARERFLACWEIPANLLPTIGSYFAEVHVFMASTGRPRDGLSVPVVSGPTPADTDTFKRLAVEAVRSCAGKLALPTATFPQWEKVIFRFDLLGLRLTAPTQPFSAPEKEEPLSPKELQALRDRLALEWNLPKGLSGEQNVVLSLRLDINGKLTAPPQVLTSGSGKDFEVVRESAVRAVFRGQPFDMLPPEKYSAWKEIELAFSPTMMELPSTKPAAGGSITQEQRNAVLRRILANWNTRDATGKKLDYPDIDIVITLDRDGNVESTPTLYGKLPDHPLAQQALQRAIAAVYKSAPFDTLPKDAYESWRVFGTTLSVKDKTN